MTFSCVVNQLVSLVGDFCRQTDSRRRDEVFLQDLS